MAADDEWKGEGIPVFIGIGSVMRWRGKGTPVEAVVGRNVRAIWPTVIQALVFESYATEER